MEPFKSPPSGNRGRTDSTPPTLPYLWENESTEDILLYPSRRRRCSPVVKVMSARVPGRRVTPGLGNHSDIF